MVTAASRWISKLVHTGMLAVSWHSYCLCERPQKKKNLEKNLVDDRQDGKSQSITGDHLRTLGVRCARTHACSQAAACGSKTKDTQCRQREADGPIEPSIAAQAKRETKRKGRRRAGQTPARTSTQYRPGCNRITVHAQDTLVNKHTRTHTASSGRGDPLRPGGLCSHYWDPTAYFYEAETNP